MFINKTDGERYFVEYVLHNTDIFDEEIGIKFNAALTADGEEVDKKIIYKLIVNFHVNLLNDSRFESFFVPEPSKTSKGTKKDKIYDVMGTQLKRLEQILNENGLEASSATIQGNHLEVDNIIRIELSEDTSEPQFTGRGKNKKRIKVHSIIPSLPYSQEIGSKLAAERISKIYDDFMNIIRNKKIMSEILGIEETDDDGKIIKAFVEQYGALWFNTKEKEKELLNQFKERSFAVLNKYIDQGDETNFEK